MRPRKPVAHKVLHKARPGKEAAAEADLPEDPAAALRLAREALLRLHDQLDGALAWVKSPSRGSDAPPALSLGATTQQALAALASLSG